jgi:hypothetical protein
MNVATPMPISDMPRNLELVLASSLFATTEAFEGLVADAVFADCLLTRAFNHLCTGLCANMDSEALMECAHNIEACGYLTKAVRKHVGQTLRALSADKVPPVLAMEIVSAAANRHTHKMIMDALCAVGSHGLDEIAGAIELLAPPTEEEVH